MSSPIVLRPGAVNLAQWRELYRGAAVRLDPAALVERVVGLDEAADALAALGSGIAGAGITVVVP